MKLIHTLKYRAAGCLAGWFVLGAPAIAGAASTLFRLEWSGASLSNSATAVGWMSIDLSLWTNNAIYGASLAGAGITDFSITVAGAATGNGDFDMTHFATIVFDPHGTSLDMTRELVGQATADDPFGTPSMGRGGDFNLFQASPTDPNGTDYFTLSAGDGEVQGTPMVLTTFTPVTAVEPSSAVLVGSSGLALLLRRRRS